ncbi:hypothetical protein HK405_015321, partial [Cladochytrium tenue]
VCRSWSFAAAAALYASPPFLRPTSLETFTRLLVAGSPPTYDYGSLLTEMNLEGPAADGVEMGDLETALGMCPNLASFRLVGCAHVSSLLLQFLADSCPDLQSLVVAGCPVGDAHVPTLIAGCPKLAHVDMSRTNVSLDAVDALATGLAWLQALFLDGAAEVRGGGGTAAPTAPAMRRTGSMPVGSKHSAALAAAASSYSLAAELAGGGVVHITPTAPYLSVVSLRGSSAISATHLRLLSHRAPHVARLNLSRAVELDDDAVAAVARGFPALAELDLDGCVRLTDVGLQAIAVHLAGVDAAALAADSAAGGGLEDDEYRTFIGGVGALGGGPDRRLAARRRRRRGSAATSASAGVATSRLRQLGLCGTGVTARGVRLVARACGALVEVRLDACERVLGTAVEAVAVDAWVRRRERRLAAAGSPKALRSPAAPGRTQPAPLAAARSASRSRLPVPVSRAGGVAAAGAGRRVSATGQDADTGLMRAAAGQLAAAASDGSRPPSGWCKLRGRAAMERVAALGDGDG